MRQSSLFSYLLVVLLLLGGATTSCQRRSVTRVDPNKEIDLSGRWNDTDSKKVSKAMVDDALGSSWLNRYRENHDGERPTMIVGLIQNKTHEHIEPQTFIKDIEREFIKSGAIRVVQNAKLREKIREERGDQQKFASEESQKQFGKELGADYMMFGYINSTVDSYKNKKVVEYQINLELADIETNELVWIGEKKIKKYITE